MAPVPTYSIFKSLKNTSHLPAQQYSRHAARIGAKYHTNIYIYIKAAKPTGQLLKNQPTAAFQHDWSSDVSICSSLEFSSHTLHTSSSFASYLLVVHPSFPHTIHASLFSLHTCCATPVLHTLHNLSFPSLHMLFILLIFILLIFILCL